MELPTTTPTTITTTMPTTTIIPPPPALPMPWPVLAFLVIVGVILIAFAVWAWQDIRDTWRWYQEVVFLDEDELRREREAELRAERRAEDNRDAANRMVNISRLTGRSLDSFFRQYRRPKLGERNMSDYVPSYYTLDTSL